MPCCLLDVFCLVATEDIDPDRASELERQIVREQRWTQPIAVHKRDFFVMDGHHRLTVAHRLGLDRIPAVLLDYGEVDVMAWRKGEIITPSDIIAMARSGRRFPAKTTRHIFDPPLPLCDIPLSDLRLVRNGHETSGTRPLVVRA
ncbi:ParB N-terminal domain-containing protein [Aureimonas sp. AU20]|uniref:ParB N-terminal domain-containing protein n=1 Tax=Aureimonas sp. AU20 TaxID=1349819 RepID=UPI000720D6FF|nr:ParB N-terminal domain-containing protein [Aureimonas sp. AU20]ALN75024.1 hypothetical protein M673_20050 [Aureimonas sp. AU20]